MIKELDDYLDIIAEKYPHIPQKELKQVLEHGFNSFLLLNKNQADVQISDWRYWAYCGRRYKNHKARLFYNSLKARRKYRLLYKYANEKYDGSYYFGLTDEEWDTYKDKIFSKHRKKVEFNNVILYKIKEECFLFKPNKYFIKTHYPIDMGWFFKKDKLISTDFEYFAYRDEKNKIINI